MLHRIFLLNYVKNHLNEHKLDPPHWITYKALCPVSLVTVQVGRGYYQPASEVAALGKSNLIIFVGIGVPLKVYQVWKAPHQGPAGEAGREILVILSIIKTKNEIYKSARRNFHTFYFHIIDAENFFSNTFFSSCHTAGIAIAKIFGFINLSPGNDDKPCRAAGRRRGRKTGAFWRVVPLGIVVKLYSFAAILAVCLCDDVPKSLIKKCSFNLPTLLRQYDTAYTARNFDKQYDTIHHSSRKNIKKNDLIPLSPLPDSLFARPRIFLFRKRAKSAAAADFFLRSFPLLSFSSSHSLQGKKVTQYLTLCVVRTQLVRTICAASWRISSSQGEN